MPLLLKPNYRCIQSFAQFGKICAFPQQLYFKYLYFDIENYLLSFQGLNNCAILQAAHKMDVK